MSSLPRELDFAADPSVTPERMNHTVFAISATHFVVVAVRAL